MGPEVKVLDQVHQDLNQIPSLIISTIEKINRKDGDGNPDLLPFMSLMQILLDSIASDMLY
jgi:hypothetical protein